MTALPTRIRRTVRHAQFDWQNDYRTREADTRRERMTVSRGVAEDPLRKMQDWSVGMGTSPSGRFQVLEEPRRKTPLISQEGIRFDFAKLLLIAIACLCAVLLLVEAGMIGTSAMQVARLDERIESVARKNETLQEQLAFSSTDISVCTEAVKLNMISSSGATTISLTAPVGANLVLVDGSEESRTEEMRTSASAAD